MHASAGKETKEKLKALKEAYFTHQQVGASEAAYRVTWCLKMKDSNIACTFVITDFPKNGSVFYKRVKDDHKDPVEDNLEGDVSEHKDDDLRSKNLQSKKKVKIDGKSGTFTESITKDMILSWMLSS